MTFDWQSIVALCVVVAAVFYLVWHVRRMGRAKRARRCGGCPAWAPKPDEPPLVQIEPSHPERLPE